MKLRLLVRISWQTVAVLVMATGCAETLLKIPPPSDKTRAEFGTVAVAPVRPNRREEVQELGADIARGEGQGAIEGVKWALEPVSEGCGKFVVPTKGAAVVCAGTIAYGIVAAPFAAVVGAIRSRPASEVEAAERSLLAAFNRMNPRTALRDQIIIAGKSMRGLKFVAIDDERSETLPGGPTTEFDSIMTVFFDASLLFDDDNINPGVTLDLQVTASIARASDDTPLHAQTWRYWSEKDEFFDLAENGARRFEEVVAKAYDPLARKIVHDLFIASTPEIQTPGEPGTVWAVDTSSFYHVVTLDPTEGADAQ